MSDYSHLEILIEAFVLRQSIKTARALVNYAENYPDACHDEIEEARDYLDHNLCC